MGLREWIRKRTADASEPDGSLPPLAALVQSIVGKDEAAGPALGEYTSSTFPTALAEQLRRRNQVAAALVRMDIATVSGRAASIPRLIELLHTYPHPMAYEALVLAYVDQGRWADAGGVAFAARERRWEVEHSPHPEIRGEVDRLKAWTPEEVEDLRREAMGELVTPGVPVVAAPRSGLGGAAPALG
jgi:hypothetical protein